MFIRPRYMVWENVPGAFSSNKGEDFRAVLEEAIRIIQPEAPSVPMPRGGGPTVDASLMEWRENGVLRGEFTTHSFMESPNAAAESRLSAILEDCPHQKYSLSAKACRGILKRAERRGKKLPEVLEAALIAQAKDR